MIQLCKARADFMKENLDNNVGKLKKKWKNIQNIQNVLPKNISYSRATFDIYDETIETVPS